MKMEPLCIIEESTDKNSEQQRCSNNEITFISHGVYEPKRLSLAALEVFEQKVLQYKYDETQSTRVYQTLNGCDQRVIQISNKSNEIYGEKMLEFMQHSIDIANRRACEETKSNNHEPCRKKHRSWKDKRERHRVYMAQKRASENLEQLLNRREKNRIRIANKRNNETPEERAVRLEQHRIYMANKRANEKPEESLKMREKQKIYVANKRANETLQELRERREKQRIYVASKRANATSEELSDRREKQRIYMANRRLTETLEEAAERRQQNRIYKLSRRVYMNRKETRSKSAKDVNYSELYVDQSRSHYFESDLKLVLTKCPDSENNSKEFVEHLSNSSQEASSPINQDPQVCIIPIHYVNESQFIGYPSLDYRNHFLKDLPSSQMKAYPESTDPTFIVPEVIYEAQSPIKQECIIEKDVGSPFEINRKVTQTSCLPEITINRPSFNIVDILKSADEKNSTTIGEEIIKSCRTNASYWLNEEQQQALLSQVVDNMVKRFGYDPPNHIKKHLASCIVNELFSYRPKKDKKEIQELFYSSEHLADSPNGQYTSTGLIESHLKDLLYITMIIKK